MALTTSIDMNKITTILAIGVMLSSTLLMMIPAQSYAQIFPIQMQLPNTAIQNQEHNPYLPPQPMSGMSTQDYMYLMQLMQQYMNLYGPNQWQDRYWQNDQVIKIIEKDDDDDDDDDNDNDHDHKHKDHNKPWWWKDGHKNKDKDWKDEKEAWKDAKCDNTRSKSCGNSDDEIEKWKDRDNENNNEEVEPEEQESDDQQPEEEHEEEESNEDDSNSNEDNSDDGGGDDSGDDGGDSDSGGGDDGGGGEEG
jgi:uncharacterized membrane protein YgcG